MRFPESRGADSRQGSGGFRCRWLMRLWSVPGQKADEIPEGCGAEADEVPEGSGADG